MYPMIRMAWQFFEHHRSPPLGPDGVHVSYHRCWPWDIDIFMELNNGRSLTIYDLGRIPMAGRMGLIPVLRRNRWALTMAGASVRWRARVRMFQRVEIRSRALGFDARFIYLEQSMWRGQTCCSHVLFRSAVTDAQGIVSPLRVVEALGWPQTSPALPQWVQNWIEAEGTRPWPPDT